VRGRAGGVVWEMAWNGRGAVGPGPGGPVLRVCRHFRDLDELGRGSSSFGLGPTAFGIIRLVLVGGMLTAQLIQFLFVITNFRPYPFVAKQKKKGRIWKHLDMIDGARSWIHE
jgi:hypothetical protein